MNRRLFAAMCFVLSCAGFCQAEPLGNDKAAIQKTAEPILENVLKAMAAGDHAAYIRDFDETMRKFSGQEDFDKAVKATKTLLGDYQSREPLGFLTVKNMTVVLWKARFSESADDLLIKLTLTKNSDKVLVSGLFFQ